MSKTTREGTQQVLLRSESPSGMCAKLRTVAASNNRDRLTRSLYCWLFAPRACVVFLHAHPVHSESHIQRNATEELATVSYNLSHCVWLVSRNAHCDQQPCVSCCQNTKGRIKDEQMNHNKQKGVICQ